MKVKINVILTQMLGQAQLAHNSMWTRLSVWLGEAEKLDDVSPFESDPTLWNSTTRQNPPFRDLPLYIAVTFEPIQIFFNAVAKPTYKF